jgi:aspartate racemase
MIQNPELLMKSRNLSSEKTKTLGIIGGMGPLATADFFRKLVSLWPAEKDQDHPRVLMDSNPKIPDRTAAFTGAGPSPVQEIIKTARNLSRAGADLLAMPCVTAHCFWDEIRKKVRTPMLSMITETSRFLTEKYPSARVGLLCTQGTFRSGIFPSSIPEIEWILPSLTLQKEQVNGAVYGPTGVKSGHVQEGRKLIKKAADSLIRSGAEVLLAGCTEVSMILLPEDYDIPVADCADILARACVREMSK